MKKSSSSKNVEKEKEKEKSAPETKALQEQQQEQQQQRWSHPRPRRMTPPVLMVVLLVVVVMVYLLVISSFTKNYELEKKNKHNNISNLGNDDDNNDETWEQQQQQHEESPFSFFHTTTIHQDNSVFQYQRRARNKKEPSNNSKDDGWTLELHPSQRVRQDYPLAFLYKDVPWDQFPSHSWQVNASYVKLFLQQGMDLVQRAQDAIRKEYYYFGSNNNNSTKQQEQSNGLFQMIIHDNDDWKTNHNNNNDTNTNSAASSYTTLRSWKGLIRRLLHAIVTQDTFVFAMGGHSAAAGHGNHFQQSYTLQVQWILEPILARLGVKMEARNFGNGGLGTLHNGMGAGSIYGFDVDILMWDSKMTEKDTPTQHVFHRQGLFMGNPKRKIPLLWTLSKDVAMDLYHAVDADVILFGNAMDGIPKAHTLEDLQNIPWAARYMKCSNELKQICKKHEYNGTCWIDQNNNNNNNTDHDRLMPMPIMMAKQRKQPDGRASWHPGNRRHQLTGRVIAFGILKALQEALELWQQSAPNDYKLDDETWHVKHYYENIQAKIQANLNNNGQNDIDHDQGGGKCDSRYRPRGLVALCHVPLKARTEYTPRAYPSYSNIRSLMPPGMAAQIEPSERPIYYPPDVFNPALHPPDDDEEEGVVDVLQIVEAGIEFAAIGSGATKRDLEAFYKRPTFAIPPHVPIGKGVHLSTQAGDEYCDGSLHSWCQRGSNDDCLLYAHNDGRNGLVFDGYSGWIVMNLPDLQYGFIVIKLETWPKPGRAWKTEYWNSINNEGEPGRRSLQHGPIVGNSTVSFHRHNNMSAASVPCHDDLVHNSSMGSRSRRVLKKKQKPVPYCDDFRFEYAIDGNITSLAAKEFQSKIVQAQRVVELLVLMDDRDYTKGEEKEVEVAIRMIGCGRVKNFKLTHIYWA